jgi:hypothetical protein
MYWQSAWSNTRDKDSWTTRQGVVVTYTSSIYQGRRRAAPPLDDLPKKSLEGSFSVHHRLQTTWLPSDEIELLQKKIKPRVVFWVMRCAKATGTEKRRTRRWWWWWLCFCSRTHLTWVIINVTYKMSSRWIDRNARTPSLRKRLG